MVTSPPPAPSTRLRLAGGSDSVSDGDDSAKSDSASGGGRGVFAFPGDPSMRLHRAQDLPMMVNDYQIYINFVDHSDICSKTLKRLSREVFTKFSGNANFSGTLSLNYFNLLGSSQKLAHAIVLVTYAILDTQFSFQLLLSSEIEPREVGPRANFEHDLIVLEHLVSALPEEDF